jgi:DNA repair protein RecO (recombination protein O)
MRVQLEPAFVLHRRPYRDSSLLLEVFSRQLGRIGLVARGVRKGKSQKSALLQPFQELMLSWSGRGELFTLTDVEPICGFGQLSRQLLLHGFYLNEITVRLLQREDPHPVLFDKYKHAIASLEAGTDAEPVLRYYERWLLQEIGYGLQLDSEAETGSAIVPERLYCYHPESGAIASDASECEGVVLHGGTLLALANESLEGKQTRLEAKRLLRCILAHHLGGKPLNSRQLFLHRSGA